MDGDSAATQTDARTAKAANQKERRERSSIAFPYADLDTAIGLAKAINNNVGGGDCDDDQLAAWTNQSAKSSTFRIDIASARTFGVLEGAGPGRHQLTELGSDILDAKRARQAKVDAFLNVPLYKAIYEKKKGGALPPPAALEKEMRDLGVAAKVTHRARRAFKKSAEQAGFNEHGKDRLVMPGIAARDEQPGGGESDSGDAGKGQEDHGGGNGGGGPPLHPFIQGLLQTLPKPETDWAIKDRAKWLQTAANVFDLIYKGDGGIKIEAAAAPRSPRPDADN